SSRLMKNGVNARQPTPAAPSGCGGNTRESDVGTWSLQLGLAFQANDAAFEIDRHTILAQELVADDPSELEAEQRARRVQIEHHHREIPVLDLIERQVHPRQQEG